MYRTAKTVLFFVQHILNICGPIDKSCIYFATRVENNHHCHDKSRWEMCLFHQASENLSEGDAKIVGSKKYVGKTCPGWRLIFLFLSSSSFFLSFKTLLRWILNTTVKDEHISSSTFCIDVSRISIFSLC